MLETIAVFLFPLALVYAGVHDLASYEIPNWLTLAITVDFLAAALAGSYGFSLVGWYLSAGLAVLFAGALLFAWGIVGGGDAKLLAACAVWVGWTGLVQFILAVAIIGGLFGLLLLWLRRANMHGSWTEKPWIRRLLSSEQGIPYGVAIGLGGIVTLGDLPWPG